MLKHFRQTGTHYIVFGNLFAAGFGMLSFMILTRILTKETFGDFTTFMAAVIIFEMIRVGIFNNAVVKYISETTISNVKKEIIGSGWVIAILVNLALTVIIMFTYLIFKQQIIDINFQYFFIYYPFFMWVSLPSNIARSVTQATQNFKIFAFLNFFTPFILFLVYCIGFFYKIDLIFIIQANVIVRLFLSILTVIMKYDYIRYIQHFTNRTFNSIIRFGKFSILSNLGSTILNSSDRLLINFILGPQFVAIWAVPLKLTEIIDNPLRSFTSASFPKMSKLYNENKITELSHLLHISIGRFMFLTVPIAVLCLIFPSVIINFLAGPSYSDSYIILQLISIFFIMLPLSRYLGLTLTAINKPKLDSNKVLGMAIVNIIGDIIVLYMFNELWPVALVTIINVIIGILIGIYYVKRYIPSFKIKKIFTVGVYQSYMSMFNKIKNYAKF